MVPYYGRHGSKQFIRGKPIRFGFKVWSLNTPLRYCIQMDPYQGAAVTDSQLGLGGSVVAKLTDCLPPAEDKYTLYFDNFFTSLNLLQFLSTENMQATGTVRANRVDNCPVLPVDKFKKMDRGTFDYRLDSLSGIIVTRWNDNSVVTLYSGFQLSWHRATGHSEEMVTVRKKVCRYHPAICHRPLQQTHWWSRQDGSERQHLSHIHQIQKMVVGSLRLSSGCGDAKCLAPLPQHCCSYTPTAGPVGISS